MGDVYPHILNYFFHWEWITIECLLGCLSRCNWYDLKLSVFSVEAKVPSVKVY